MYIYLDESFQLKRGTENQFLTVAGFSTNDPQRIAKMVNRIKKHTLPKKLRQQENQMWFDLIKPKLKKIVANPLSFSP